MNPIKTILAGSLAVALVHTASADVTIRITGSSAFRAATHNAIKNLFTFSAGQGYAYEGSSFTGANHAIFKGTFPGITGVTTIKTSWSGSVAGVRDVVQGNNVAFLPDATTLATTGQSGATGFTDSAVGDIAMSDTFQGSTKFPSTPPLADAIVGVVPFAWVASKDAPAGLTNLTPQLARAVFKTGFASAALFSNNNADASDQAGGTMVYAIGRDPFSGTRLTALAESGVGVNTVLAQYQPIAATISSNAVTQIQLTPADVANGVLEGDNGFASGGTLADNIRYGTTAVEDTVNSPGETHKICFVTYLGEGDANRAVNGTGSAVAGGSAGNAHYLTYNGVAAFGGLAATLNVSTVNASATVTLTSGNTTGLVAGQAIKNGTSTGIPVDATIASIVDATTITLSANATATSTGTATTTNLLPTAIRNGAYTFWGYEHIMWKTTLSGDKLIGANAIKTQITNTDYFASGIANDAAMRVRRATDGGTVIGQYY